MASYPRSLSLPRLSAVALVLALSGCGGGGSPSGPSNIPAPVVKTRSVIGTISFSLVGVPRARQLGLPFDYQGNDLTFNPAGDLDAVVDWTFASNDVNLYLTSSSCTDAQFRTVNGCTILRSTESQTGKPRTLTSPGLAAGNYKIWVTNFGNTSESGTIQVGATR